MENNKEALMKDVNQKLAEINEMEQMESNLKDNANEFIYKDKVYRVHRPVSFEKDLINKERMKKYVEFLQDPSYMFRKQLVDLLKTKGVDIVQMEYKGQKLYAQEKELLIKLAKTSIKQEIDAHKADIEAVRYEAQQLFLEKEEFLKYCIEKQLEDFVRFYLLYTVLEVKNGEAWERVYKSYDEFEKSDDDLMLGRATQILTGLVYNEKF